ncbi:NAD-glutamate dehydrogenase [Acidipropionibacterium timonense]|uniref:NAD-glutamate dehydrogenase n=1 Tax=Acidipropionibacterium timonense TaxID=2161818 RepID=UPI00398C60E8
MREETISLVGETSAADARAARAYLAHVTDADLADRSADAVAAIIRHHLDLARDLDEGQIVVDVETSPAWAQGASSTVQVVMADHPFLVDTVLLTMQRQGWTIGEVFHPVLSVRRQQGHLEAVEARGGHGFHDESWVCVEAMAPLGADPRVTGAQVREGLQSALADLQTITEDWRSMREQMREAADLVGASAGSSDDRDSSVELLGWLIDDHFVFHGYEEFVVDGTTMTPVEGSALGVCRHEDGPRFDAVAGPDDHATVVLTKDSHRSTIQRNAYRDYVGVRVRDEQGHVVGERRFLGLLGSAAYTESVDRIPVLRAKANRVLALSGYRADSHGGKAIIRALAGYPRDELFEAGAEELTPIVTSIIGLRERRRVRSFVRPGRWGRFLHVLVFIPRDRFTADTVDVVRGIVEKVSGAEEVEGRGAMSDSSLVRVHVTARMPEGVTLPTIDEKDLEAQLSEATRTWEDGFIDLAGSLPADRRGVEFAPEYKSEFTPRQGLLDLELLNALPADAALGLVMYRPDDPTDPSDLRLKIFNPTSAMSLSQVMPHLSSLGVQVLDEHPHRIVLRGREIWLFDLGLAVAGGRDWTAEDRHRFTDAFEASWLGRGEPDTFGGLVVAAGMTWQQVAVLRGMARYLRQLGVRFSQSYMARALVANPDLARGLVTVFETKFDPTAFDDGDRAGTARQEAAEKATAEVIAGLDTVASLDQDRILRMMVQVLSAMVRTNHYQPGRRALAFKVIPTLIDVAPAPRPRFEIFVNSPRVSGTHLRFGHVARGGLRWSDRPEDFRTEVLGLVKAQMVKNSVIVPAGAKGGFVPARLPDPTTDRAGWAAEGTECYRIFVGSLLDLTDNIVDRAVIAPAHVVRHDEDDPYLVVAADKGTAKFSDTANAISAERGFWLGDGFASGGSHGYDHKAMGITARGAWESVKRHLADLGIDESADDFTTVGIGDMSGDVFGNGMLLSKHIKLVGAFNHRHVFVDPNPDPLISWNERKRLFDLPRSSWGDYDAQLISAGGGVWPRTAKSVPVSAQMRQVLGLADGVTQLTPDELISAILRAPVDLLWNGGIGTYVKATTETHDQVGDRTNDAVRIDATHVRARCAGEGGNLGWTQAGRIEYAVGGGRINTDFIDNSAGVDTSDHEVNIKILLDAEVAAGRLSVEERDALLPRMADDVAALVLRHNTSQNVALANSLGRGGALNSVLEAWMEQLEQSGHLDRVVETMPSKEEMARRAAAGESLHSPELCTLLAWTKIALCDAALATDLPEDPYVAERLVAYFPPLLRERFAASMPRHRLHREIITTEAVNRFVDSQGITAFHRLHAATGADIAQVIRAQVAARSIFAMGQVETTVSRCGLPPKLGAEVRFDLRDIVKDATRWLLNHGGTRDIARTVEDFAPGIERVVTNLETMLGDDGADVTARRTELEASEVPERVARTISARSWTSVLLDVVDISRTSGHDLDDVAATFLRLARRVHLDALTRAVEALPQGSPAESQVRAGLRHDLLGCLGAATRTALAEGEDNVLIGVDTLADEVSAAPGLAELVMVVRRLRASVGS